MSRTADTVTLRSTSPRGAAVGVGYAYDMPHCGALSPIDIDGSFWDAAGLDSTSDGFGGWSGTFRLTDPNSATFTLAEGGSALKLVRHSGTKTFWLCS